MSVKTATRKTPQPIAAVQVAQVDAAAIYALFANTSSKYSVTTQNDAAYAAQGGTRISIARADYPTQFAYPGDWLVVYDATFDASTTTWTVSDATEIEVWGISAGLPGTAEDFTNLFTVA